VRFSLGAGGGALMTDMPNYGESRPNERHRTENEDAKQNSHRGEDNKWWEEEGAGGAAGVTQSGKMAAAGGSLYWTRFSDSLRAL
jgi:hypothetical protein